MSFPMTLAGVKRNASTADLVTCDFSYNCARVSKISIDKAHRMLPLRYVRFL